MMGIISIIFFGDIRLGFILLVFWIIRILKLKSITVSKITTLIVVIFVFICFYTSLSLKNNFVEQPKSISTTLMIYPDEIKKTDQGYYGIFESLKGGKKYLAFGKDKRLLKKSSACEITVDGQITQIDGPRNFNQFDSSDYYKSLGVMNKLSIDKIKTFKRSHDNKIIDWLHYIRKKMIDFSDTLPSPLDVYTKSLFLGSMDSSFNDELIGVKTLGLIHLFSISGLHVFYIVSLISLILKRLKLTKETRLIITCLFLPTYFIIAGSSVGLLRSILSVEIGMVFALFKRSITSLDIYSITLMVNLFLQPMMLTQFGSQLSYALAFALIYTSGMSTIKQTIMMNLVSLPFVIYKLYEWHLLTMFANYLVIPIFSIIVMPAILIAIVTYPITETISQVVASGLKLFDNGLNLVGNLPGEIVFGKPNIFVTTCIFVITLLVLDNHKSKKTSLLILLYVGSFLWIHYPIQGEVSFFDVGQGDSILVRTPFNTSIIVIDTGGKINFNDKNTIHYQAPRTSINYLKSIGISHIDNLVFTHQDFDHTGDAGAFLSELYVKRLIIGSGMQNNKQLMDRIKKDMSNTKMQLVLAGKHINNFPFNIYHPFKPGLGSNDDSIVLGTTINNKKWLFMGDLPSTGESDILNKYKNIKADYLKLGHHGSKNSSSNEFLKSIHPEMAIISSGRNNRYHHPNVETLNRLKLNHIGYLNTQNQGMISYRYGLLGSRWITELQGEVQ